VIGELAAGLAALDALTPSPSPAEFRAHFPLLARKAYLYGCSLGPRSSHLDAAVLCMLEDMSFDRGPWVKFGEQAYQARRHFAELIGAQVGQIALVPNASVGAYQVASTLRWDAQPRIVTAVAEFPSIAHVWLAQRPRGAEVVFARSAQEYATLIDERTRLVSVPLVTYRDAVRQPVAELSALAHRAGARSFVDAYQAVGTEPVRVERLGCDYLVAGTMKYLLGLPGLSFLYARSPETADCDPQLTGWFGRVNPFAWDPQQLDFPPKATRFETGTPAVPSLYAANAGLSMISRLDLQRVRAHIQELTATAAERLAAQGEVVRTPSPAQRGAHIGLVDADPEKMAAWLAEHDVVTSPRDGIIRLAFHYYNDTDDIDRLCHAVAGYRSSG